MQSYKLPVRLIHAFNVKYRSVNCVQYTRYAYICQHQIIYIMYSGA